MPAGSTPANSALLCPACDLPMAAAFALPSQTQRGWSEPSSSSQTPGCCGATPAQSIICSACKCATVHILLIELPNEMCQTHFCKLWHSSNDPASSDGNLRDNLASKCSLLGKALAIYAPNAVRGAHQQTCCSHAHTSKMSIQPLTVSGRATCLFRPKLDRSCA